MSENYAYTLVSCYYMETIHDIALKEFYSENENGKYRLTYAYFGLAIYFGQCIEETFSIMLWTDGIFKKKPKANKEVNEIIDSIENSRKTMGKLLNEVKQSYKFTKKQIIALDEILKDRNYLAHKYFKLNIQKFYSEVGQLEMIKYFCDFIEKSELIDKELNSLYRNYTDKLGLTDEKISELMNDMKLQEIKRNKI